MVVKADIRVKCPSCGIDRYELIDMLNTPLVWQSWDGEDGHHITPAKSDKQLQAEALICKCDLCFKFFYGG